MGFLRQNAIALLALAVALSGTAYAAQIGSSDIEHDAIRTFHIRDGQVRERDLADSLSRQLGFTRARTVEGSPVSLAGRASGLARAACPRGTFVVGGGIYGRRDRHERALQRSRR